MGQAGSRAYMGESGVLSARKFAIAGRIAYIWRMPRIPIELPPEVARAFLADMRAFFAAGHNQIKKDEIAARQLWILKQHWNGKLRITGVREMFEQMKDQV
jgi:hypothetical protein